MADRLLEFISPAPSKPSKHPSRNARPSSPTQHRSSAELPQSTSLPSLTSGPLGWKSGAAPASKIGINLAEKVQPLSFVLQAPEEQTDNWDDDFEEGISFTKLQGARGSSNASSQSTLTLWAALEKPAADASDDDRNEMEDNAQTIRPNRSPGINTIPLAQPPPAEIPPIVEDYSDMASEEDEAWLQEKVANFKVLSSLSLASIPSLLSPFAPDSTL